MKGLLLTGIGLSILAVVSVAGCTTRPTTLGPDAGLAYTMAHDNQILNPEAEETVHPVYGMEDGNASKHTMDRYRSSFEKPEDYRTTIKSPSIVTQGIQTR